MARLRSRRFLALVVAIVALGAGACRVQTDVGITVNPNGSGSVTVRIGLDDDALHRAANVLQSLQTTDLQAHGWSVTGPVKEADNLTYITATKQFANPTEAAAVFTEISGANGPFRDFRITRSTGFARTKYSFEGTVDFAAGLEAFSDSDLAAQLDGKPLGQDLQAIQDAIGEPLDNAFQFRVAVRLPGDVTSNAPQRAANGAVWQPRLSQPGPVSMHASSTSTRWQTIIGTAVAALAGLIVVVVVVVRIVIGTRRRRRSAAATPSG